ncbi:MAG: reverse transcriptase domain-containing protein [Thermoanaerobacterales bacterium]|nr:reverse transcriptase domain-containing protein [Thermoanaerobacterales bacterium]
MRYADDILIFAETPRRAQKYLQIAIKILEGELKLVINKDKTHITSVYEGVPYLGFVIWPKVVTIHPKKIKKFKDRIRELTPRNHGKNIKQIIKD